LKKKDFVVMEVKATVTYKGSKAHYSIKEDTRGIYSATLIDYEGGSHNMPPVHLVITKGVRHWIGSIDDDVLTNELGGAIEINLQSGIFFKNETKKIEEDKLTDEVTE